MPLFLVYCMNKTRLLSSDTTYWFLISCADMKYLVAGNSIIFPFPNKSSILEELCRYILMLFTAAQSVDKNV